jgi:hypothetical protein
MLLRALGLNSTCRTAQTHVRGASTVANLQRAECQGFLLSITVEGSRACSDRLVRRQGRRVCVAAALHLMLLHELLPRQAVIAAAAGTRAVLSRSACKAGLRAVQQASVNLEGLALWNAAEHVEQVFGGARLRSAWRTAT